MAKALDVESQGLGLFQCLALASWVTLGESLTPLNLLWLL